MTDETQPQPASATPSTNVTSPSSSGEENMATLSLNEEWLQTFYKECGREATLAYTTLNQMKNWAILITGAAISGLAFGAKASDYPTAIMYAGSVIVYIFVLRFYVRSILCYNNLVRWNILQNDCVQLRLIPRIKVPQPSPAELETTFRTHLQSFYYEWLAPLARKDQLSQNLKLAFYPLFGLSLFFVSWGAIKLWSDPLVKGLTVFAVLDTVLEANDFFKSKFFDNPEAWNRKKKSKSTAIDIFPVPASRGGFLLGWIANVLISLAVATWPGVKVGLHHWFCTR